ncbi:MAG: YidB family protein [Candidatus Binatia bacterium]
MGLLDDLLAGLGDAGRDRQPAGRPANQSQAQGGGGGMGQIMMALLPVVLAMLRSRGGSAPQAGAPQNAGSGGLGLDDLLGAVFGGGAQSGGGQSGGGGLGGLGELLSQLQRAGFGEQANSWVGRGQNMPLTPDAMEQVFGSGGVAEIARRAGVSEADATRGLAQLLPEVVDRVTPNGQVPDFDALSASVDNLTARR